MHMAETYNSEIVERSTFDTSVRRSRFLALIALALLFVSSLGTLMYIGSGTVIVETLKANGSMWGNSQYFSIYGLFGDSSGPFGGIGLILHFLAFVTCVLLVVAVSIRSAKGYRNMLIASVILFSLVVIVGLISNAIVMSLCWTSYRHDFSPIISSLQAFNVYTGLPFPSTNNLYAALDSRGLLKFWQYPDDSYWMPFEYPVGDHSAYHYTLPGAYILSFHIFTLMRTAAMILLAFALFKFPRKKSVPSTQGVVAHHSVNTQQVSAIDLESPLQNQFCRSCGTKVQAQGQAFCGVCGSAI